MDTLRLALSAKQLAAIPDAPVVTVLEVHEIREAIVALQQMVVTLQRDVAELQHGPKGEPHVTKPDRVPRTPEPY